MNAKLKNFALMLGLIAILAVPASAQNIYRDEPAGGITSDLPGLLLAGNSSLLATGNQKPAPKADQQSAAPKLIAAEPLFEFGRVLEGTEVVHDFLIENNGTGDLTIDQVRTG